MKDAFEGSNTEVSKASSEAVVQERKVERRVIAMAGVMEKEKAVLAWT